jgi:DNA repair protein SbcC/Rad50
MLRRLELTNVRRHVHTVVELDPDDQLVLIAGENGTGKTSILEGIGLAMFGETRHGRRGLDAVARRGGDGTWSVEVVADLPGGTWRIRRERSNTSSKAWAWVNEVLVADTPNAVTAQVEAALGMDAAGFRLAVIAQQNELDGLASLRPAERVQMVNRLLRLDTLTATRDALKADWKAQHAALDAAADLPSVQALKAELAEVGGDRTAIAGAVTAGLGAVALLEGRLGELVVAEQQHIDATAARNAVLRERDAADEAVRAAEAALEALPSPTDERSLATVSTEIAALEAELRAGEAAQRRYEQRLDNDQRVIELQAALSAEVPAAADLSVLVACADHASDRVAVAAAAVEALVGEVAAQESTLSHLRDAHTAADASTSSCDSCGQDIDPEHQARHRDELGRRLTAATARLGELLDALTAARRDHDEAARAAERAAAAVREGERRNQDRARVLTERAGLRRRLDVAAAAAERFVDAAPVELSGLYARRAELELDAVNARAAESSRQQRDRATATVLAALSRRTHAERTLDAAVIDAACAAAAEAAHAVRRELETEREMLNGLQTRAAVLDERAANLRAAVFDARKAHQDRARRERLALDTANAAKILTAAIGSLSARVRPELENQVASLLARMSAGRYAQVRFDDDFEISVADDGVWVPLVELSGGERDLVALAVRLALANLLGLRAGGPVGFVILDECFGSQDASRRQAILDALRAVRASYGQVLLISHVGGIEDTVDRVVTVTIDDTDHHASVA